MVCFMCQLVWTTVYPDIWSNPSLRFLWGCFLMRLTFKLIGWIEQIALPNEGGPYAISWALKKIKNSCFCLFVCLFVWFYKRQFFLPDGFWAGLSPPDFKFELKRLKPVSLQMGTTPSILLVLRPSDSDWKWTRAFLYLQLAGPPYRSWDLSSSVITWANSLP